MVAYIDENIYKQVLQNQSTQKCYSIRSIRLPHVSSIQRGMHPPKCLLPELFVHGGMGDYLFILTSHKEAIARAMNREMIQNSDLFSFRVPDKKGMEMAQMIRLVDDPIDCVMVVGITAVTRLQPAPTFYMAGHYT